MNIHFGLKALAASLAILLVTLLINNKSESASAAPESPLIEGTVTPPTHSSSPKLVICGSDSDISQPRKSSSIYMVSCGPY